MIGTCSLSRGSDNFKAENLKGVEGSLLVFKGIKSKIGEIARDVERTFPLIPYFATGKDGQWQLFRILVGLSNYLPNIRYCQGMNYVAATLLLVQTHNKVYENISCVSNLEPEEIAFWSLSAIIENHEMEDMWKSGIPAYVVKIV